jgi:hypothetical protein
VEDDMTPRHPSWGWLYLLATLLIGLLGLVEAVVAAGARRRTLEIVVCVVTFVAMHLWVRVNRHALELLGDRDHGLRRVVAEPVPSDPVGHGRDTGIRSPHRAAAKPATTQDTRRGTVVALRSADVLCARDEGVIAPWHTTVGVGHRRRVE